LSAVEAFREIITAYRIAPESIQRVSIRVPKKCMAIIDRPRIPSNRLESAMSVHYQIALTAFDPIRLRDVKRETIIDNDQVCRLIKKIEVKASEEFENYPASALPAKVEIQSGDQTYSREIVYPKGDSHNPFDWEEVTSKFRWVASPVLRTEVVDSVVEMVREIDVGIKNPSQLVQLIT
jgi:2-methylcitrate dehydratase PrpD